VGEGRREPDFSVLFFLSEKRNHLESGGAFSFPKVVKIAFVGEKTSAIFFVFLFRRLPFLAISLLDGDFSVFGKIVDKYDGYQIVN